MIILVAIEDELCGADLNGLQIDYTGFRKNKCCPQEAEVIRRSPQNK